MDILYTKDRLQIGDNIISAILIMSGVMILLAILSQLLAAYDQKNMYLG